MIRCVRIWTGDDDNSHFAEGVIDLERGPHGDILTGKLPVTTVSFQETASGGTLDWQTRRSASWSLRSAARWISRPAADSISRSSRATSCWPRIPPAAATAGNWSTISPGGAFTWCSAPAPPVPFRPRKLDCTWPSVEPPSVDRKEASMNQSRAADTDIVLVGAGIMSATLAVFLKELEPSLRIEIFEMLEGAALESSDAWNNAGTGHAALCELNYTPERRDGSIDISKALEVNVEFDLSRQFWSLSDPQEGDRVAGFVHPRGAAYELRSRRRPRRLPQEAIRRADRAPSLPGHGIHRGQADIAGLDPAGHGGPAGLRRRRRDPHDHRRGRELRSVDPQSDRLSADARRLRHSLFAPRHRLDAIDGGRWRIDAIDAANNTQTSTTAKFVFLGAGGGALPLLQKSGIPEANGMPASRSAASGCAATIRRSTSAITPRSTAWPTSARRRCPFRTSNPGNRRHPFDSVRALCRASPLSSSNTARGSICSPRSGPATFCR